MKRQRWKSGDIVKIALPNGTYCYGWVIRFGLIEFLDVNSKDILSIEYLTKCKRLFVLAVTRLAITKGTWAIVGNAPRNDAGEFFQFFMQDMFTKKLSIYGTNGESFSEIPATYDDCIKLERMAVWDEFQIEDRLIAYYGGTPRFPVDLMEPVPVLN
jgi:Immunity protein 26